MTLSRRHLLPLAGLCLAGWIVQFLGHQMWKYFPILSPRGAAFGNWALGLTLLALIAPALVIIARRPRRTAPLGDEAAGGWRGDLVAMGLLTLIGAGLWWGFASDAASFPRHVFGDESFHSPRSTMMREDAAAWLDYLRGTKPEAPFHAAHYVMYPALGYVPNAAVAALLGDGTSLTHHRLALLPQFLLIALGSFCLARSLQLSRWTSALFAAVPGTSPLLLSYTMSFYIELPYVVVLLGAFALLATGIRAQRFDLVCAAALVASLAPLVRESAFPATFAIGLGAAGWLVLDSGRRVLLRVLGGLWLIALTLVPFVIFYLGKSNYTSRDQGLLSVANLLRQDYGALALYSMLYLGPAILTLVLGSLAGLRQHFILIATAAVSLVGELGIYALFAPGYMPWTRNYLMFYAPLLVLAAVGAWLLAHRSPGTHRGLRWLLVAGCMVNLVVAVGSLSNNRLFHESETVFLENQVLDDAFRNHPSLSGAVIYSHRPFHLPPPTFPGGCSLSTVEKFKDNPYFLPFGSVTAHLAPEVRYVLFYWFQNDARPKAFHDLPRAPRPQANDLAGYRILAQADDPWSGGRSGVMLLERASVPAPPAPTSVPAP